MARPMIAADVVEVVRPHYVTDGYGNTVPDWTSATRTSYTGSVQPTSGAAVTGNRDGTVASWRAFLWPEDADIRPTDRIEYAGRVFEIDGDVGRWTIAGLGSHIEADLRAWEG